MTDQRDRITDAIMQRYDEELARQQGGGVPLSERWSADPQTFMQRGLREWPAAGNVEDRRGEGAVTRILDELGWTHPVEIMTRQRRVNDYLNRPEPTSQLSYAAGLSSIGRDPLYTGMQ